jgi:pimeloyl-ACP methyl ester carboxylesterase
MDVRLRRCVGVAAAVLMAAGIAGAQRPNRAPKVPMGQMSLVTTAQGTTEIGWQGGAEYRIDVPPGWSKDGGKTGGGLLVFYHGYALAPYYYNPGPLGGFPAWAESQGYAVIQSGYSEYGWALQWAEPETENLRKYFDAKYGEPKENYVTGQSMGGALTLYTIEKSPEIYNGALAMCGPNAPTYDFIQMRTAQLAAFEYYFPGLLPPVEKIPTDYVETPALMAKLKAAVEANPKAAAEMTALSGVRGAEDLAAKAMYAVYVAMDLQKKSGGQPFDNKDLIYYGTSDDTGLNRGVQRYSGDQRAAQYLVQYFTQTGELLRPTLALHTIYDRLIPPPTIFGYSNLVTRMGHKENLAVQWGNDQGHCSFTVPQQATAFKELLDWVHSGKKPDAVEIPTGMPAKLQ